MREWMVPWTAFALASILSVAKRWGVNDLYINRTVCAAGAVAFVLWGIFTTPLLFFLYAMSTDSPKAYTRPGDYAALALLTLILYSPSFLVYFVTTRVLDWVVRKLAELDRIGVINILGWASFMSWVVIATPLLFYLFTDTVWLMLMSPFFYSPALIAHFVTTRVLAWLFIPRIKKKPKKQ